jgi:hypothetical protein
MNKRGRYTLVTIVLTFACAAAGLTLVVNRLTHRGEGPRHTYSLSGKDALTDEQAIALAKQTLELDGRFSGTMQLITFGDDSVVSRGDDKSFVSVGWQERSARQWYVQIHRTPERVDAVSYPGK